jgi:alpha/beta superfamily hydrolase
VPADFVLGWARGLEPAPQVELMQGAGHFFHGRINELRDLIVAFDPA